MTDAWLTLRAASGPTQGAGHVARAVALAQAWLDQGGRAVLVAGQVPELWRRRCRDEGLEVVEPGEIEPEAGEPFPAGASAWAVLDGYGFTGADQERWRARAGHLLVVDDHATAGRWAADLVLDQNLGARSDAYGPVRSRPPLLLGPRYALLRREFRPTAPHDPSVGHDPAGPAGEVRGSAGAGGGRGPVRVALAAGGAPRPEVRAWFEEVAGELRALGHEVVQLAGVADVASTLAGVDLAVSASGGSAWELCALGIAAALVPVAANQAPVAEELERIGAAVWLRSGGQAPAPGPAAELALPSVSRAVGTIQDLATDREARAELARRAQAVVDGRGALRVAVRLRAELLELRPAQPGDARTLWTWANDPDTRAQSFGQDPIPWDRHLAWFEERLADPEAPIYLARDDAGLVGQVRMAPASLQDSVGGRQASTGVEVGVVVAPDRRGQHLAGPLIDAGVRRAARELGRGGRLAVLARIKVSNASSQRSFLAADFDPAPDASGRAQGWLRYTRQLHEPEG